MEALVLQKSDTAADLGLTLWAGFFTPSSDGIHCVTSSIKIIDALASKQYTGVINSASLD